LASHPDHFRPVASGVAARSIVRSTDHDGHQYSETDRFACERAIREARAFLERVAADPSNHESGSNEPPQDRRRPRDATPAGLARDAALRAIERHDELSAEAADRLDDFVRRNRLGLDARYLAAVADEAYLSAFMRRITSPDTAAHDMSPAEQRRHGG
jgi:hypothetical protein